MLLGGGFNIMKRGIEILQTGYRVEHTRHTKNTETQKTRASRCVEQTTPISIIISLIDICCASSTSALYKKLPSERVLH